MSADDDLRNAQFPPPPSRAEKLEAVARDLAAANGTTTADELAKAAALPQYEHVTLHARRHVAAMKVKRARLTDARFTTSETGDDFMRNQLTAKLEAEIYGEQVEAAEQVKEIAAEIRGETTIDVTRTETVHRVDRPARTVGLLALVAMAVLPLPWSWIAAVFLAAAIHASSRWGERSVTDTLAVPYEDVHIVPVRLSRVTWAMYPDAKIPQRPTDQFGKPVKVLQFDAVQDRSTS